MAYDHRPSGRLSFLLCDCAETVHAEGASPIAGIAASFMMCRMRIGPDFFPLFLFTVGEPHVH